MQRAVSVALLAFIVACGNQAPRPGSEIAVKADLAADAVPVSVPKSACQDGMVEIDGEYCPNVEEVCLRWVGIHGEPVPPPSKSHPTGRCGEFQFPTRCLSTKTIHKHFCIDRYEYPNVEGQKPKSWVSWSDMKRTCESQGKRLCTRSEWTFACEGPKAKPYPYGDGYHRDRTACNFDNELPKEIKSILNVKRQDSTDGRILDALLVPAGSMKRCVSDFGVHDMVGNIDESVINESGWPYVSGLMSGHVFGVRNACRPMTEAHGPTFSWYETGGRCCSETEGDWEDP